MSSDLTAALADFFAGTWPTDRPIAESGPLPETRWRSFADLGLHLVGVPEELGGSGGSFDDLRALAVLVGRHAADVPVVESTTAAWMLAAARLPVDGGSALSLPVGDSALTVHEDGTVSGTVTDVPWGASVDAVVAIADDGRTVALRSADATLRPGLDLAGQPRDSLTFSGAQPVGIGDGVSRDDVRRRAVALRVALMAGALQAVSELTQGYVSQRVQFGKAIGRFQAVQAHVVQIEQMAVMTSVLAERLAVGPRLHEVEVNAAHLVAAENALVAVRAAHQAHGAIGMTREYRLQGYTRRLHTWSSDFAEVIDLARGLGALAATAPSFAQMILDDPGQEAS